MHDRAFEIVYGAVRELNEQMESAEQRIALLPESALFGREGRLDSLGLVNLIVLAEHRIEDAFGVTITLADERAMSLEKSPFRTIATFAEYVDTLLKESGRA